MKFLFKLFIKLVLATCIVFFALWNHRFFSFYKGFSKTSYEDYGIVQTLNELENIEKVEYYEKVIKSDDSQYKVYILTSEYAYLLDASQDDIDTMKTMTVFNDDNKPQQFKPIPFYVEVIVGAAILAIPFGWKKKDKFHND